MTISSFTLTLEGASPAVRQGLAEIREKLTAAGEPENLLGRMEIVLAEVLNNIVEHAFAQMKDGLITISLNKDGGDWTIKVEDNGEGMPVEALPNGQLPTLAADFHDLPEGGFGWALVEMLTKDLLYTRQHNGNRLEFDLPASSSLE